jgi:hypothetical protein
MSLKKDKAALDVRQYLYMNEQERKIVLTKLVAELREF